MWAICCLLYSISSHSPPFPSQHPLTHTCTQILGYTCACTHTRMHARTHTLMHASTHAQICLNNTLIVKACIQRPCGRLHNSPRPGCCSCVCNLNQTWIRSLTSFSFQMHHGSARLPQTTALCSRPQMPYSGILLVHRI